MYNQYILIDQMNAGKSSYSQLSRLADGIEQGPKLTQPNIDSSILEDYEFEQIGATEEEKDRGADAGEPKPADPNAAAAGTPQPKPEDAGEESQEDQDADNSDGEEFQLFYDADEIESVKGDQQEDAFTDLVDQRHDAVISNCVRRTMIDIGSMAPKENESLKNQANKSKRGKSRTGKSMKSSQTGEQIDEFKANEEEVDTAL